MGEEEDLIVELCFTTRLNVYQTILEVKLRQLTDAMKTTWSPVSGNFQARVSAVGVKGSTGH